jgi:phage baseplate assembly protein W
MNEFLGRGPVFPFKPDSGGRFPMAEDHELVENCFEQAILTEFSSRPMQKSLGSKANRLIFMLEGEQRDTVIQELAKKAIDGLEGRVIILSATVQDGDNGDVFVSFNYQIITEDVPRNKVVKVI